MTFLRPAVFLDRDGTLNVALVRDGKPFPPENTEEFILLPGVVEGCHRLREAGFVLVVVTNQPDVGRGIQSREAVDEIHQLMLRLLPIDGVEVCFDPGWGESSEFRKPRPGMLLRAAEKMGLDLSRSWIVGDRWRDVDCGVNAGVRTVFIDWGYDEELRSQPDFTVSDFPAAVQTILTQSNAQSTFQRLRNP